MTVDEKKKNLKKKLYIYKETTCVVGIMGVMGETQG